MFLCTVLRLYALVGHGFGASPAASDPASSLSWRFPKLQCDLVKQSAHTQMTLKPRCRHRWTRLVRQVVGQLVGQLVEPPHLGQSRLSNDSGFGPGATSHLALARAEPDTVPLGAMAVIVALANIALA